MTTKSLPIDRDFCIQKLRSAISLAESLADGDYPHDDPKEALACITGVYKAELERLKKIRDTASFETTSEFCRRANIQIRLLKPFVGLILRSSNIRNAFEMYFPIKSLSWALIKGKPRVILGSEWSFSPFTYPIALKDLPSFVFIGIPAAECQNPLIIPLAAHELGHVVWNRGGAKSEMENSIKEEIIGYYEDNWDEFNRLHKTSFDAERIQSDMFVRKEWSQSYAFAQRQIEEIFCDYIALMVFGRAFLFAFRYLVAPSLGRQRNRKYPRIADRAKYMIDAARVMKFSVPADFEAAFSEEEISLTQADDFVQRAADTATKNIVPSLVSLVKRYKGRCRKYIEDNPSEKKSKWCMQNLVPPLDNVTVAALANAAWSIRVDIDIWPILAEIRDEDKRRAEKIRVLAEITLKSFEIFEYNCRIAKSRRAPKNAPQL